MSLISPNKKLQFLTVYPKSNSYGKDNLSKEELKDILAEFSLENKSKMLSDINFEEICRSPSHALRRLLLENNLCFEVRILLHFVSTGKLFANCSDVVREIKNKTSLSGYHKSEKYLATSRLYQNYKNALIDNAIPNTQRLEISRHDFSERYPRAETFRFFE